MVGLREGEGEGGERGREREGGRGRERGRGTETKVYGSISETLNVTFDKSKRCVNNTRSLP